MSGWRDKRVPEFQDHLRNVLGREPTERDYAAAVMQLEQRGPGSIAVGHAFRNRMEIEGGDPSKHLRHYDPIALGHRWGEVTPQAIDKWGQHYDRISGGEGPLRSGQTHFFSPAGMQAYYDKDPSLVRSAVRMHVPGHGEVLVPNWATKAVAAGDYTNVNGEWFLTPNERYGQQPAQHRHQDAEAQPGGFYGNAAPPTTPQPTAAPAPPVASSNDQPSVPSSPAGGATPNPADTAMRVAKAFSPQTQRETEDIIDTSPRMRGGQQMPSAPIPYLDRTKTAMQLTRADGGSVVDTKPPEGGAGRFASPVQLSIPKEDREAKTRRLIDSVSGVGRLPFADGGAVNDTGVNVPETRESLMAQQRQLIEGRRAAQMFPSGTQELPLPPGMGRIETERGVYHFDPMQVTAADVEGASATGRENEILGLGPLSKDDVMDIVRRTGEAPVAITERDPRGNEVRASVATPSTVSMQSDQILRSASPDSIVDVEPLEDVVMARGRDQTHDGYASGGGISDTLKGLAGSGLFGIAPMAFADGVDEEDLISPMAGLMKMKARGGGIAGGPVVGPLTGATGGRADKIPATARSGSHVVPADIVSHMGQGNTNAGMTALSKMFKTGPYGIPLSRGRRGFADGGEIESEIPVMLSDGEFVIPPEMVAEVGDGDIATGHDIIDQWILGERQKSIETIAALPPPATD